MMKKIILTLIGATLLTACQKEDKNGDLGGNWKLLQIEELNNNSVIDKRDEDRFWAIQLDLILIGNGKGRFQHIDDSLFVQMIYKTHQPAEYGLYNQDNARYGIEHLSRKRMVLRCNDKELTFRKF